MRFDVNKIFKDISQFTLENGIFIDKECSIHDVTEQFSTNADNYHEKYTNIPAWTYILDKSLRHASIDKTRQMTILDIGSGSGNTIFAAISLFKNCNFIVNDISPKLLKILLNLYNGLEVSNENVLVPFCFDIHKPFFQEGVFDLVIGGAILHHLYSPEILLKGLASCLKKDGKIILVEPLEVGSHILNSLHYTILNECTLNDTLSQHFLSMCVAYETRYGFPRINPHTIHLDDKWFFSKFSLRHLAKSVGLELVDVVPITENFENFYFDKITLHMMLLGENHSLSTEVVDIINLFDKSISQELKKFFDLEGILIFQHQSLIKNDSLPKFRFLKDAQKNLGVANIYDNYNGTSVDSWIQTLMQSVQSQNIDGIDFPVFPPDDFQHSMVGPSGIGTIHEMGTFYRELHSVVSKTPFIFQPYTHILDFGCGFGRLTRFFLRDTEAQNIFGTDCTKEFIDICKATFPEGTVPTFNFMLNNPMPPIDIPTASIDIITAYSVFTHLSEHAATAWLAEMHRILKPGGLFVFTLRQKTFLEQCASYGTIQERSYYEDLLYKAYGDFSSTIAQYVRGEYMYHPSGGGYDLSSDFYGETVVPPAYVRKHWCKDFTLVEMFDDINRVSQAFCVLQVK